MNFSSDVKLINPFSRYHKKREVEWKSTFLDLGIHFEREQYELEKNFPYESCGKYYCPSLTIFHRNLTNSLDAKAQSIDLNWRKTAVIFNCRHLKN